MSIVHYHGAWAADVPYGAGALVTSGGALYLYTATQPLRSATAPTDDAVHWSALGAPPPPPAPWSDDFSRPDQAGWGTASGGFLWNSDWGGDPAELAIVSGTGVASGGSSVVVSPTGYSGADQRMLVKVARGGPNAKIIMAQRVTISDQYYCFVDVDGTVAIRKLHSGSDSGLAGGTVPFTIGDAYWFSFQCVGTALEARWWADGDPEPGSPTLSATDSLISAPGRVQMELPTFGGSVTIYSFALTDLS